MKLLLSPEKIITSTTKEEWLRSGSSNLILFTSGDNKDYIDLMEKWRVKIFKEIFLFENYASNNFLSLKAIEISNKYKIDKIIPMSEADIIRSAHLRESLNIDGQNVESAYLFRDKIKMKEHAMTHGILVPHFRRIRDFVDLIFFIKEVGYPVIIKPTMGRGSMNTFLIQDDTQLMKIMGDRLINSAFGDANFLAEKYIDGEVYHIDGLQVDSKVKLISVSKYVNNCLSFVNGSYLGSYTLSDENLLKNKLTLYAKKLIQSIFSLPKNSLFHIEVFVDRDEDILLCEIACRLGGNGINDEIMLQQGVDIKMEYIRAEVGSDEYIKGNSIGKKSNVSARVLIPPKNGKLIDIPTDCPINGVLRYHTRGCIGIEYKKMEMSNNEIANFLITGQDEYEVQEKINEVVNWFYKKIKWEIF